MDEEAVFGHLKKQQKAVLLDYLRAAFAAMTVSQRRAVFADAVRPPASRTVDGGRLREEIDDFRRDSLTQRYYAPFNVNSKNYVEVPEATEEWCDLFARYVAKVSKLTTKGKHAEAVACFAILYELLEAVDSGKEIIFAEEAGSWMLPTDEKQWLKSYLTSLAATATLEGFTAAVLPMLARDRGNSFAGRVYTSALDVATTAQKTHLQAEVQRRQLRTGP